MSTLTTGVQNTAVGYTALTSNTSASFNTATGVSALMSTTTGGSNTAVGSNALAANTTASFNTAVGRLALTDNTTGANNSALGNQALELNLIGQNNTAMGSQTLIDTTGSGNTAIGSGAGSVVGSGTNNTFVGYDAGATAGLTNATAIGYNATAGASYTLILGNGFVNVGIGTSTPGYTLHVVGIAGLSSGSTWTVASDRRLKDIHGDYEYGLDEILKIHTIRFNYKKDNAMGLPSDHPMTGVIAQEVQKVIPDAVHENKKGYLELNVDPIHWAAINAIKQLYAKVISLASGQDQKILELQKQNAALKALVCQDHPTALICK